VGEPGLQAGEDGIEMSGITACPKLADRLWVTPAQARITADASAGARRVQAGFGALGDQRAFELGDGAEHLKREHALRGCGVDRVAQAAEMRASGFELLDDGEQVADRARRTTARVSPGRISTGRLRPPPQPPKR
jgi:hypothetical protein